MTKETVTISMPSTLTVWPFSFLVMVMVIVMAASTTQSVDTMKVIAIISMRNTPTVLHCIVSVVLVMVTIVMVT